MSLNPAIRSRFGGSKVRTGCNTCKARHVKCDEKRPTCERCIKAGRPCGGYAPTNQTEKKYEQELVIINYVAQLEDTPCIQPTREHLEQRSLTFFTTRTVPELAGGFDAELWSRYILRTAYYEPAIRHAVIALGALHEWFENAGDPQISASEFGLQQYGKAIQQVVDSAKVGAHQSTDVALISCILFTAFESLQGHYKSALTHVNSGLKVLAEREDNGDSQYASYIPKELLRSLFVRMDTQAHEIGDLGFRPYDKKIMGHVEIPKRFSSLDEAQRTLDQYLNILLHFLQSADSIMRETVTDTIPSEQQQNSIQQHQDLIHTFHAWCVAFDDLVAEHLMNTANCASILERKPHPGIYLLQLWKIVIKIMLNIELGFGEVAFDSFIEEAGEVVDLAESYINETMVPNRVPQQPKGVRMVQVRKGSAMENKSFKSTTSGKTTSVSQGWFCIQPDATPLVSASATSPSFSSSSSSSGDTSFPSMSSRRTPGARNGVPLAPKPPMGAKPTFSLSLGLVTPLYMMTTRCRDPSIRRRALHLLQTCNRKEGIWDSRLSARVAQRVVEIEEAGAVPRPEDGPPEPGCRVIVVSADQIPELARIRELEATFLPDRQGRIRYTKSTGSGAQKSSLYTEELLNW